MPTDGVEKPPKYKLVVNLRPPCSACGKPLILTRIEPDAPGHDLRIQAGVVCGRSAPAHGRDSTQKGPPHGPPAWARPGISSAPL